MSEVTRIPKRTLLGGLLCRLSFHRWYATGTAQRVIPTGNALLVVSRVQPIICQRPGCRARRENVYRRAVVGPTGGDR